MVELPKYWKLYNKKPFNFPEGEVLDHVYMICLYERKRALLVRQGLKVICTMETRKAMQLLNDAGTNDWIIDNQYQVKLFKYLNYPKEIREAFWIKYK